MRQRQRRGAVALPLIVSMIWPYAAGLLAGMMAPAAAQAAVGDACVVTKFWMSAGSSLIMYSIDGLVGQDGKCRETTNANLNKALAGHLCTAPVGDGSLYRIIGRTTTDGVCSSTDEMLCLKTADMSQSTVSPFSCMQTGLVCRTLTGMPGNIQQNGSCMEFGVNRNFIVQTDYDRTSFTPAAVGVLRDLEAQALAAVRESHNLSPADDDIIYDSARDEMRGFMFAGLVKIAKKTTWTVGEQDLMSSYAEKIRAKRLAGANFSLNEYNKWRNTVCGKAPGSTLAGTGWSPPAGFSYDWYTQSVPACNARGTSVLFSAGPIPPSFSEFISYGTAAANNALKTDPQAVLSNIKAANAVTLGAVLGGSAAAGLGGTALGVIFQGVSVPLVEAIANGAISTVIVVVNGVSTTTEVLGAIGAAEAIGAPLAIITAAITILVHQAITVFSNAEIPQKLQKNVENNNVTPDMRQLVQTTASLQEFFPAFIASTLPEAPPTKMPPAANVNDAKFSMNHGSSVAASISLKSTVASVSQSVRLSGGWLVNTVTNGVGAPQTNYSTSVSYVNWDGVNMTAWRKGNTFVHTVEKQTTPDAGFVSDEIHYKDPSGANMVASLGDMDKLVPQIFPSLNRRADWSRDPAVVQWNVENPLASSSALTKTGCVNETVSVSGIYTRSCTATNAAGTSTKSISFKVDNTPPTVSVSRSSPASFVGGWNRSLSLSFKCEDAHSGMAASCPAPTGYLADGSYSYRATVDDKVGNRAFLDIPVAIDSVAPTVTAKRLTAANANGWNNTDVLLSFACQDDRSGINLCAFGTPRTMTAEGAGQSATARATDWAGNEGTGTVSGINIDKTKPTVALTVVPAPNANNWNNTNVTVTPTCGDSLSGVQSCPPASLAAEGANQPVNITVTDKAGNSAAATQAVNIDKTAPSCSVSVFPNTLEADGGMGTVAATVTPVDALSGVAGVTLASVWGGDSALDYAGWAFDTDDREGQVATKLTSAGANRSYTLNYKVVDKAGNAATCSTNVTVVPHVTPGTEAGSPSYLDTDMDGVVDPRDNCKFRANANQRDTDGDLIGNACDADLDQSNVVDAADLARIQSKLGKPAVGEDLNGNGIVDPVDLTLAKAYLGRAPGPSGLRESIAGGVPLM